KGTGGRQARTSHSATRPAKPKRIANTVRKRGIPVFLRAGSPRRCQGMVRFTSLEHIILPGALHHDKGGADVLETDQGGGKRRAGIAWPECTQGAAIPLHQLARMMLLSKNVI